METARLERIFYVVLLAIAIFLSYVIIAPYIGALVLAATLAIVFGPWYRGLVRAFRYESLAASLTVLIAVIIVFVPLAFFGVRIFGEATSLYTSLSANGGFNFRSRGHEIPPA